MPIQTLSLKNYGVFRNAEFLGLSPLTIVVGANGTGKSTLFDVFSFLKDALAHNVHQAAARRGGFRELASRGAEGPVEVVVGYSGGDEQVLVYGLTLAEHDGRVVVESEHLHSQAEGSERFMDFKRGQGTAISGPCGKGDRDAGARAVYRLNDASTLAINALGQFSDYPLIAEFRSLIERWHLSDLQPSNVRVSISAGHAEHLSTTGDNAAQVAEYLRERHPQRFREVLEAMRRRVPGVDAVEVKTTEDNRLLLRFKDNRIADPFHATYVSDGTIKMLVYLLLLHDPSPHPLLAVEEPENHLYPGCLGNFTEEFRGYANRGSQVLVSTQSFEFLNEARLDEVFWLEKKDGFSTPHRAAESDLLQALYQEGDPPGALWRQQLFGKVDP